MRKVYRLKDLDCANCAAKMERAIQKINGITFAEVNFMAQKLTIETEEDSLVEVMEKVKVCVAKVEPDCIILGA